MKPVFIVAAKRTPIGSFNGALRSKSATELGALVIAASIESTPIPKQQITEVYMGNVLSANLGQAPARQAALQAGLDASTICTTINKVCASGMKATMLAAQSIMLGTNDLVIAGGMESMSNVPYYAEQARFGGRLGHQQLLDGIIKDGLWDVTNQIHMGSAAEHTARQLGITRSMQDTYAIESYKRAAKAWQENVFANEIVPVTVTKGKETQQVAIDEEFTNVQFDKIPSLKPVFEKEGTITAANASTLNDGAACVLLASERAVNEYNLKPLAQICSFADAAQAPIDFATAPALAIPKALQHGGIKASEIGLYEINEAFSAVSLANLQLLKIDASVCNIRGGAVSLGHPLGASGVRIIVTLLHSMIAQNTLYGVAGICNGGGGASAIVIKKI